MIKRILITFVTILVVLLLSPVILRKRTVPFRSDDGVLVVATRPLPSLWQDNQCDVYRGESRVFSLWIDFFNFPLFMYLFPDAQRVLCIYDDDTAVLVFVVDMTRATPTQPTDRWPSADYVRNYIAGRATNVVFNTTGLVRLPTLPELQEVSRHIASVSPSQFRTESFPSIDLGFYRAYWPKENLLPKLATNRTNVW